MINTYQSGQLAPNTEIWIKIPPSILGLHLHIIPISLGVNPNYDQVQYEITENQTDFVQPVEGTFYFDTNGNINQASIEYQYFNACNNNQAFLHIKNLSVSNSNIQYQLTTSDGYVFTSVVYDIIP